MDQKFEEFRAVINYNSKTYFDQEKRVIDERRENQRRNKEEVEQQMRDRKKEEQQLKNDKVFKKYGKPKMNRSKPKLIKKKKVIKNLTQE